MSGHQDIRCLAKACEKGLPLLDKMRTSFSTIEKLSALAHSSASDLYDLSSADEIGLSPWYCVRTLVHAERFMARIVVNNRGGFLLSQRLPNGGIYPATGCYRSSYSMTVGERSSGGDASGRLPLDPAMLSKAKPGFFLPRHRRLVADLPASVSVC
jgi:hypothetical protein